MEWISIKERLPNEGQEVLCFDAIHRGIGLGILTYQDTLTYRFYGIGDKNSIECTHWMPIPEIPE
jgi:hypothetical protein